MGLMTERSGPYEYEAVCLPAEPGATAGGSRSAVFLRRSARPSRRAVLHLHDMSGSVAPADLARWYNERGFHFYVTDLDLHEPVEIIPRHRPGRSAQACFAALDAACSHLRQTGIDAIILSAQESAAGPAAAWCDARSEGRPVDALILSNPRFGREVHAGLDITCPVLVVTARRDRRTRRAGPEGVRLGEHVTWLHLDPSSAAELTPQRRRLFDEMGRWLGAYMYGQVRDQLL